MLWCSEQLSIDCRAARVAICWIAVETANSSRSMQIRRREDDREKVTACRWSVLSEHLPTDGYLCREISLSAQRFAHR